jgi:hypothetical protein
MRLPNGTFARVRQPWTVDKWDDGIVNNRGRFLVYRPDCPRAYADGYALRAHVVWWLETGEVHQPGWNLHHKNENPLDDRFENLEAIKHGDHIRLHQAVEQVSKVCPTCGTTFSRPPWKAKRQKFCSLGCRRRS